MTGGRHRSNNGDDAEVVDMDRLKQDEELIEALRRGENPKLDPDDDLLTDLLAAWRESVQPDNDEGSQK